MSIALPAQIKRLFKRLKPPLLGVDIGADSVKLVELSRTSDDHYRLESYAIEALPAGAFIEQEIKDLDAITEALLRAYRRTQSRLTHAACAIGGNAVISKIIQMPAFLSTDELSAHIRVEADRYIPFPIDEISLDFEILQTNELNHEVVDVLLVAARTEHVDARVDVLLSAGLQAKVVDVEAFAMARAIGLMDDAPVTSKHKMIAVLDLGAHSSSLYVMHRQRPIYTREHYFGWNSLIEQLKKRKDLTFEQAFLAMRYSELQEHEFSEILNSFKNTLIEQIQRELQLFSSATSASTVDQLFLAGGMVSVTAGLAADLSVGLSLPCVIAHPFVNLSISENIDKNALQHDAPALLVSTGLALGVM